MEHLVQAIVAAIATDVDAVAAAVAIVLLLLLLLLLPSRWLLFVFACCC